MWNSLKCHQTFLKTFSTRFDLSRGKKLIDKSRIPEINASDIEEHFIRGGGPGGQKANKTNNCVHLFHKPTGVNLKVHDTRSLEQNRKIAKMRLTRLLDNLINNERSVEYQLDLLNKKRIKKKTQKQKKLCEMKSDWRKFISWDPPVKD